MKKFLMIFGIISTLLTINKVYSRSQVIYSIQMEIFKNDTVVLQNISADEGVISTFPTFETDYKIKVLSHEDTVLFEKNVAVSFIITIGEIRTLKLNSTSIHLRVPYYPTATSINLYHNNNKILNIDLSKYLCDRNDVCDLGENEFNCPEDCKRPRKLPWTYIIIGGIVVVLVVIAIFLYKKKTSEKETDSGFETLYSKWKR